MEKQVTYAQLKAIHTLLNKQGLSDHKKELVHSFSDGRTESSRELTLNEAKRFIQYLKDCDESEKIIKRIWHLAYLANIIYGDTPEDKAMNASKLNQFVESRGTVKKSLHKQTIKELKRTVKQLEAIVQKTKGKNDLKEAIALLNKDIGLYSKYEMYEAAQECVDTIAMIKETPSLASAYLKGRKQSLELTNK